MSPSVTAHAARVTGVLLLGVVALHVGCDDQINLPATPDASAGFDGNGPIPIDAGLDDAEAAAPLTNGCPPEDASFGVPSDLACTGLYDDFVNKTLGTDVIPYDPGLHFWSDGADKTRWLYLPPNQKIDNTDPNEWTFPTGTKAWKEFKIAGHRVETRMWWKRGPNDWLRATYRWSDDEQTAISLTEGAANVGGTSYSIPTIQQCDTCHAGRIDKLLGVEAVSMASPLAKYGDVAGLDGLALRLLVPVNKNDFQIPDDGTGKAAPALGWLHANCGTACHNPSPSAFAGTTGLFMRVDVTAGKVGPLRATNTFKTAVNQPARFAIDPPPGGWIRLVPHDVPHSLIPARDRNRNDPQFQMPPIASNIPDLDGTALVLDWITNGDFGDAGAPPATDAGTDAGP